MEVWLRTSILLSAILLTAAQYCPWDQSGLTEWSPSSDPNADHVLQGNGNKYRVTGDIVANSITIRDGATLIFDPDTASIDVVVSYIYIHSNGAMYVGSHNCPYPSNINFLLTGRADDGTSSVSDFGRKFIGVGNKGTLVMVGPERLHWTRLAQTLNGGSSNAIITLEEDHDWVTGDDIVIAPTSTDYTEAEDFTLLDCPECNSKQVKISGIAQYTHLAEKSRGVDIAAEVGLLSRTIQVHGEMQSACYPAGSTVCQYFSNDVFGGQIHINEGYRQADIVGVELYDMGQQHSLGNYPIHYHMATDGTDSIVYGNSIHKSHARCVAIHGTNGLVVENNVAYDILGHCYFLEDGNEQSNRFLHNLGVLIKPGLLLPSDRDEYMCTTYLDNTYGSYIPDPRIECMGASVFWIAHPNNMFIENAAAGSVNNGFFYAFYRETTGDSAGALEPYHGERSALGYFNGNTAHSNADFGLLVDRGVKITQASASEPQEYLSLLDYARYMPHHRNRPLNPRIPAFFRNFNCYRNSVGAFIRGGDIWMEDAIFTDNNIGISFASQDTLPHDSGSHQEIINCEFNGYTGLEGRDLSDIDTLIGLVINDGPITASHLHFQNYLDRGTTSSGSFGFRDGDPGQNTPANTIESITFDNADKVLLATGASDGDMTQMFHDLDGSVTGADDSYMVRLGNNLMSDGSCSVNAPGGYSVCSNHRYTQLYVNATTKTHNLNVDRDGDSNTYVFYGANKDDFIGYQDTTNYQPVLMVNYTYNLNWDSVPPNQVILAAHNMTKYDYVLIVSTYPSELSLDIYYDEWIQMEDRVNRTVQMTSGSSSNDVMNDPDGFTYYYWTEMQWLYIKMINRYADDGYNYCAAEGCQRVHVNRS